MDEEFLKILNRRCGGFGKPQSKGTLMRSSTSVSCTWKVSEFPKIAKSLRGGFRKQQTKGTLMRRRPSPNFMARTHLLPKRRHL